MQSLSTKNRDFEFDILFITKFVETENNFP